MESAENKNSDYETKMLKEQENHQGQTDDYNYSKKEFWNDRFGKTTGNFDWYADWTQLKPKFTKIINVESSILMVGCGNSKMSTQMIKDGYKNITNIDISDVVINKMKSEYPDEIYIEMDATNMTFKDNSFDCLVDKGTLDALMCANDLDLPSKLLKEMYRVTKVGGYFTVVTHGEPKYRLDIFKKIFTDDMYELEYEKIKLSFMSNLINSIRNTTADHTIKSGIKDKNILIASILDAFVNSYDDEELTEDQKKAKKRAELQLKLRKMLNKYGDKEDAVKKIKEGEEAPKEEKNSEEKGKGKIVRRNHCYLYVFKKLK